MADQGRWFKLWNTAPSDGKIQALPPALRWAWAAFGCYTKVHGVHGVVTVQRSNSVLAAEMGVTVEVLFEVILSFPNMLFDMTMVDNGILTVTWMNWKKYQEDSTVYDRVKKWREEKSVTVQEEKRREEKRNTLRINSMDGFVAFWNLYPRRVAKLAAISAWKKLRPDQDLRDKIMNALAIQIETDLSKREKDRIPYPATWLNGRRWEDELMAPQATDDLFTKLKMASEREN